MRTTVVLPQELIRAAKARSAESGESLKTFLTRAVAAELAVQHARPGQQARVKLPLVGSSAGRKVRVTNANVEHALADADAALVTPGGAGKSSRRGRAR
jgi:hypothetical protein